MPYSKIMIHFIWATKDREPRITKTLKPDLLSHIIDNAKRNKIFIDTINCVENHVHMLVSMTREQSVSQIAMLVKGESSFWVNKHKLTKVKFAWQEEYIALSVGLGTNVKNVRQYILNQEEHHKTTSFQEEYDRFMESLRDTEGRG